MSEAKAFVALSTLLPYPAEIHFRTNLNGGSHQSGVTYWPEAIHYVLRTYAAPVRDVRSFGKLKLHPTTRRRVGEIVLQTL